MADQNEQMMYRGMDEQGNPILIPKEQWRTEVLPAMVKDAWDEAPTLYGIISLAVDNDMAQDVLEAAHRAFEIDTFAERAATMLSMVLIRAERMEKARQVIDDYLVENEKTGHILSVLARIHGLSGDRDAMESTLNEALTLDPNNETALDWMARLLQEKGEEIDGMMRRVAEYEGAWRPQTWLAHQAIEAKDKQSAVELFREAIINSDAGMEPVNVAAMDLLKAGYLIELMSLIEDRFDVQKHGPSVGLALVQAYLQTSQKAKGILTLNKIEGIDAKLDESVHELRKSFAKLPNE